MNTFEIENGMLKAYHGDAESVVIPENVMFINADVFQNHTEILSVTIPHIVEYIGAYAFAGCTNLKTVRVSKPSHLHAAKNLEYALPKNKGKLTEQGLNFALHNGYICSNAFANCTSLTFIDFPDRIHALEGGFLSDVVFKNCTSLTKFIIPEHLTYLETSIFINCPNLNEIVVAENHPKFISIDGLLYSKDRKTLLLCPPARTEVIIPEGVETILGSPLDGGAFYGCSELVSVTLPESLKTICPNAFGKCVKLKHLTLPENIQEIERLAFHECSELKLQYRQYIVTSDFVSRGDEDLIAIMKDRKFTVSSAMTFKAQLLFEMYFSAPEKDVLKYIQENSEELLKALIDNQNTEVIRRILESGQFITQQNIDVLIQHAIEQKAYDIQVMLTDFKVQNFGFDMPDLKL